MDPEHVGQPCVAHQARTARSAGAIPTGWTIRNRDDLEPGAIDITNPAGERINIAANAGNPAFKMLYALAGDLLRAAPAAPASSTLTNDDAPMELALCESTRLVLREGRAYRFVRVNDCPTCAAMSEASREAYGAPPQ